MLQHVNSIKHYYVFCQSQLFVITVSGEKLTTRLRVSAFKAMLHQTIGWHDDEEHTTGSLSTLLSVDANSVKNVSMKDITMS